MSLVSGPAPLLLPQQQQQQLLLPAVVGKRSAIVTFRLQFVGTGAAAEAALEWI
jgi:hypothetical protein